MRTSEARGGPGGPRGGKSTGRVHTNYPSIKASLTAPVPPRAPPHGSSVSHPGVSDPHALSQVEIKYLTPLVGVEKLPREIFLVRLAVLASSRKIMVENVADEHRRGKAAGCTHVARATCGRGARACIACIVVRATAPQSVSRKYRASCCASLMGRRRRVCEVVSSSSYPSRSRTGLEPPGPGPDRHARPIGESDGVAYVCIPFTAWTRCHCHPAVRPEAYWRYARGLLEAF